MQNQEQKVRMKSEKFRRIYPKWFIIHLMHFAKLNKISHINRNNIDGALIGFSKPTWWLVNIELYLLHRFRPVPCRYP